MHRNRTRGSRGSHQEQIGRGGEEHGGRTQSGGFGSVAQKCTPSVARPRRPSAVLCSALLIVAVPAAQCGRLQPHQLGLGEALPGRCDSVLVVPLPPIHKYTVLTTAA